MVQDTHASSAPSAPPSCPIVSEAVVFKGLSEQLPTVDHLSSSAVDTTGHHQDTYPHEARMAIMEDTAGCTALVDTSALDEEPMLSSISGSSGAEIKPSELSQKQEDAAPLVSSGFEVGDIPSSAILDASEQLLVAAVASDTECSELGSIRYSGDCSESAANPAESLELCSESLAKSLGGCASPQGPPALSLSALPVPTVPGDVLFQADAKDISGALPEEVPTPEPGKSPEDEGEASYAEAATVEERGAMSAVAQLPGQSQTAITPHFTVLPSADTLATSAATPLADRDGLLSRTPSPLGSCNEPTEGPNCASDSLLLPAPQTQIDLAATDPTNQRTPYADCLIPERIERDCGDNEASDANLGLEDIFKPDGIVYDLPPSSPPPSSSPLPIFSSPPRECYCTPPSSSPPLPVPEDKGSSMEESSKLSESAAAEDHGALVDIDDKNDERVADPSSYVDTESSEKSPKRTKLERILPALSDAPLPKRPTQASIAKQRNKLAAPFRSPVIKGSLVQGGLHAVYATGRAFMPPPPRKMRADDIAGPAPANRLDSTLANKDRTANAAKQFKSPLAFSDALTSHSSNPAGRLPSVKTTPTIQSLQGKLQTLKQAIKIKKSENGQEEDELEQLVRKWTTVGREVAWAVWDYVKDVDPGAGGIVGQNNSGWPSSGGDDYWDTRTGQKRGFDPSWGYNDDDHVAKKRKSEGDEDTEMGDEEAAPTLQHTLGTMLRHLSIDPATLGWDEEEGDFVDV
ncbi:hypothetical protein C8Q70DRAFT_931083 [Cubamyces menziesii]|nr:hypothetical protein C8Q70DRAFT_931083 [Cubamyces menziesii]